MGKSLAGGFDRLIRFRGRRVAALSNTIIRRQPTFLFIGEASHAR